MHDHLSVSGFGIFQELYSIVEHALDLFADMVFQVVSFVHDALVLKVIRTVVRRTVDYMRDTVFL